MRRVALTAVVMLVAVLATSVGARDLDQDEALRLRNDGVIMPLERLLESALSRYPGSSLLEAELEEDDGRYIYEVDLLTREGVARELELDGATGEILVDKDDD